MSPWLMALVGDRWTGDGIFSGLGARAAPGIYRLTLTSEDEFGNAANATVDGDLRLAPLMPGP